MSALDDARAAVQRSDQAQKDRALTVFVVNRETRALRDALRALIQHVEELEERLDAHVQKPHARPRRVY